MEMQILKKEASKKKFFKKISESLEKQIVKNILEKKFWEKILKKEFWKKNFVKKILEKNLKKRGKNFDIKKFGKINYKTKIFINEIHSNIDMLSAILCLPC